MLNTALSLSHVLGHHPLCGLVLKDHPYGILICTDSWDSQTTPGHGLVAKTGDVFVLGTVPI